jgi:hypothetical protein
MKFKEKTFLSDEDYGPTGGWTDKGLDEGETLLIGEKCICKWEETIDDRGGYNHFIFPAFYNGKKSFLQRRRWWAGEGYSSGNDGKHEEIIKFEDGVKLLLEHGAYEWMFENEGSLSRLPGVRKLTGG